MDMRSEEINIIFRIMDSDGMGTISLTDLSAAIARIKGFAKGRDLVHILSLLSSATNQSESVISRMNAIDISIQSTHNTMDKFDRKTREWLDSRIRKAELFEADTLKAIQRKRLVDKAALTLSNSRG